MTSQLKPEIKDEWLRRLRSGNYKQGQHSLKRQTPDGEMLHCCLGVLCEIAAEAGVARPSKRVADENDGTVYTFDHDAGLLPSAVAEWSGLDGPSPNLDNPYGNIPEVKGTDLAHNDTIYLTELNDTGFNFSTIANLIERYM